ncbi:hypothetical protein Tco_0694105 [Tanacetum coccineum]
MPTSSIFGFYRRRRVFVFSNEPCAVVHVLVVNMDPNSKSFIEGKCLACEKGANDRTYRKQRICWSSKLYNALLMHWNNLAVQKASVKAEITRILARQPVRIAAMAGLSSLMCVVSRILSYFFKPTHASAVSVAVSIAMLIPLSVWQTIRFAAMADASAFSIASISEPHRHISDPRLPGKTQDHLQIFNKRTLEWATEDANKGCEATKGTPIQANMDIKDADYFHQLFQLKKAYRITGFSCEQTGAWDRTLENPTSLIFGRHVDLIELPNDGFPEYYFNFASYNELPARADGRNVILTETVGRIQAVNRVYTSGDATTNCIDQRTIDIQNLRSCHFLDNMMKWWNCGRRIAGLFSTKHHVVVQIFMSLQLRLSFSASFLGDLDEAVEIWTGTCCGSSSVREEFKEENKWTARPRLNI